MWMARGVSPFWSLRQKKIENFNHVQQNLVQICNNFGHQILHLAWVWIRMNVDPQH
jgi:hypothetical protein